MNKDFLKMEDNYLSADLLHLCGYAKKDVFLPQGKLRAMNKSELGGEPCGCGFKRKTS